MDGLAQHNKHLLERHFLVLAKDAEQFGLTDLVLHEFLKTFPDYAWEALLEGRFKGRHVETKIKLGVMDALRVSPSDYARSIGEMLKIAIISLMRDEPAPAEQKEIEQPALLLQ